MKKLLKCEACGKLVPVEWDEAAISSMKEYGIDTERMTTRCDPCQKALEEELGYHPKPKPKPEPKPMSEGEVKARLPLVTLAKIGPAQKACSKCKTLYNERWLDEDGECPKCQGAELKQGELL